VSDSLLIRGGTVVTAADAYDADVLVESGVVAAIGDGRSLPPASRTIDAAGLYVLPGCVDPHAHFQTPSGGTVTCDDFTDGTIAAAHGGTTTALHFCVQERGEPFAETVRRWRGLLADAPPVVDVGFHMMVTDLDQGGTVADLAALPGQGITSFKVFMAGEVMLDGRALLHVMQVAGKSGARVMVHAEDGEAIDVLIEDALRRGDIAPRCHAETRPPSTEASATTRAIELAQLAGARLYIVHVSCAASLAAIARGRADGGFVHGETCPQYLLLDRSCLDGDADAAAPYVFSPPPRSPADQEALWQGLAAGELSTIGSDHGPYLLSDKRGRADFSKIPNGLPGIETRLGLTYHHGVLTQRLTLTRMVELLATAPAKLFGLYPHKGTIAVGSDADLVVFDPNSTDVISAATHHSSVDYNPYEGVKLDGAARTVLVRGKVVVDHGQLKAEPGHGRWLKRARCGEARRAQSRR
jgi:dihydropyrimidinase